MDDRDFLHLYSFLSAYEFDDIGLLLLVQIMFDLALRINAKELDFHLKLLSIFKNIISREKY